MRRGSLDATPPIGGAGKIVEAITRARNTLRGDVTSNTVESYFSIFKRGMHGVYQHCSEKHLHRYLAEFDFRYNNRMSLGYSDDDRAIAAVRGGDGKRLTYKKPSEARL